MSKQPNGAILSDCQLYRYALWRTQEEGYNLIVGDEEIIGPIVAFIGVNPSTADASINDATVRKWLGFCKVQGWRKFLVCNLFAYRATDVNDLKKVEDPVGSENDKWTQTIISKADILIPCWGNKSKTPKELRSRIDTVEQMLKDSRKPVLCFGKTASGCPKHPLMLGYDTKMENYFNE